MFIAKSHIPSLIFLLISWASALHAQSTLSNKGKFEVNYVKGCSSLEVKINEVAGQTNGGLINYRYSQVGGNTTNLVTPPAGGLIYSLPNPGTYYIIQLEGSTNQSPELDSIRIEVVEPEAPVFQVYNCGNRRVSVEVQPGMYDYYIAKKSATDPDSVRLGPENYFRNFLNFTSSGTKNIIVEGRFDSDEGLAFHGNCGGNNATVEVSDKLNVAFIQDLTADIQDGTILISYDIQPNTLQILEVQKEGSGSFVHLDTLEGNEITLTNTEISSDYFCYRISTHNFCDGEKQYSQTFCTAAISGNSLPNGNEIIYQTAPSDEIQKVTLLKNGQQIHDFETASNGTYTDMEVSCQTTYSYAIEIAYNTGNSITQNFPLTTTLNGDLKEPENIVSFWEDNLPVFDVKLPFPPEEVQYYASKINGNRGENSTKSDSSQFKTPDSGINSCYSFTYTDACGNTSFPSTEVCALYLSNSSSQPDVLEMRWNDYTGYKEGVAEYRLEKIGTNGQSSQLIYTGLGTSYDFGEQPLSESGSRYIVKALPVNSSLEISSSNIYDFQIVMDAYFPNAFTPNGDQKNDNFKVEGKFVTSCVLEIFNSWGELIYHTDDKEKGWDGTVKDQSIAPQGTYIYSALIKTEDGKEQNKRGTVFLLRK